MSHIYVLNICFSLEYLLYISNAIGYFKSPYFFPKLLQWLPILANLPSTVMQSNFVTPIIKIL